MDLIRFITKRRKWLLTATLLFLIGAFLLLTVFVVFDPFSYLDLHITEEVQEHNNLLLDNLMKLISWFGNFPVSVIMVLLAALLFRLAGYKKEAVYTVITLATGAVSWGLKLLINRPRPADDLVKILEHARQQSFPSGHTLFYTVFFGFLIIIMGNIKLLPGWLRLTIAIISVLMILLIPISRIYLGAHWFTDVLGGFILGVIYLFIMAFFYLGMSVKEEKPI